ncbi:hypothetical protein MFMK1_003524 [Metallumcola ferriviriculae]|uniref:Doubled CXXCH motif domain-containing protein n=1 Tax=Metallumcola ferriviriculae TaxID=3039180 RepID=A0AAU0USP7_9FIRM|nr:hypothetical protein MFMK1_003524 [Desulfitibacteraceae bacterium MK1]
MGKRGLSWITIALIFTSMQLAEAAAADIGDRWDSGFQVLLAEQDGRVWDLSSEPRVLQGLSDIVAVSGSTSHYLFLQSNGTVWAGGNNNYGQLGDGTTSWKAAVQTKGITSATRISTGENHSLALMKDGTVYAWGDNSSGQVGAGGVKVTEPLKIPGLTNMVEISGGWKSSLALGSDGTVWKWGNSEYQPRKVTGLSSVTDVAAGSGYWLTLMADGTIMGWGINSEGQLGDGSGSHQQTPVKVNGLESVTKVETGLGHSLALLTDGTVWAWGTNENGQLGNGSKANSLVPVRVNGLSDVAAIAAGRNNSAAITKDGKVWLWGEINASVVATEMEFTTGIVQDAEAGTTGEQLLPGAGKTGPEVSYLGTNANRSNLGTDIVEGYNMSQDYKVRRAEGNNFVHGQFKKNTNACASCHMTHIAAGEMLLIQNGIYNTCTACHDGTIGKLNVFDIPPYDAQVEAANFANIGGGTFGGMLDKAENASMHRPTGYLTLTAAPGGNRALDADLNADGINDIETESWLGEFTCSSCHQPHGTYSDRLLVPNPANIERQAVTIADWQVIDDTIGNEVWGAVYNGALIPGPWVYGEQYGKGMTQTVVFEAIYNIDTNVTPMVIDPNKSQAEAGYILPESSHLNKQFAINYAEGVAEIRDGYYPSEPLKIAIVPAMVVIVDRGKFQGDNDLAAAGVYTVDETDDQTPAANQYIQGLDGSITRWKGANETENGGLNGITWFCAACHTDYYADKFKTEEGGLEGKYTTAYRHTINREMLPNKASPAEQLFVYEYGIYEGAAQDVLTCLSCHYAHGTTMQIMRNADDTQADSADVNPSSAIKRYVNMAVCWKCHAEQHNAELVNTESYYSQDVFNIKLSNGGL